MLIKVEKRQKTQVQLGWGQKTPGQLGKQQMEMKLFQKKCKKVRIKKII